MKNLAQKLREQEASFLDAVKEICNQIAMLLSSHTDWCVES